MNFINIKYWVLYFVINSILVAGGIKDEVEKEISNLFDEEVEIKIQKVLIPPVIKNKIEIECRQRFFREEVYLWKILKSDSVFAYAILDNVFGKSLPITFLVVFNGDGKIISSSIIKYREPYGGGIVNLNWNDQFVGKDRNSDFEVGEDIQGISGATISVNSVTKGINKQCLLISEIKDSL